MYIFQDPPESEEDAGGSNGHMVGDIGHETYATNAGDVDCGHDVAGPDWDGDVDSL